MLVQFDKFLCAVMPSEAFQIFGLSLLQEQSHEAKEQLTQLEQEFKENAETKATIPAMWRPMH